MAWDDLQEQEKAETIADLVAILIAGGIFGLIVFGLHLFGIIDVSSFGR